MKLTQEEIRTLSQACGEYGWLEIPSSCPEAFRVAICEKRVALLAGKQQRGKATADLTERKRKAQQLLDEINSQKEADADELLKLKAEAMSLFL